MQAYLNKPELKDLLVKEIEWHEEQDAIKQGTYGVGKGNDWKGCAVGCSIRSLNLKLGTKYKTDDHGVYEKALGIPRIIARLEDRIFEGLPVEEAKKFPRKFAEAITPGVDLALVWPKFAVWVLTDETHGVLKYAKKDSTKKSIQDVADAYTRVIKGETVEIGEWADLRNAAYAAYAAAAYAAAAYAADAAAAYAADADAAAAYAAADAAADAAAAYAADAAAAYAADAADARTKFYQACSEKFLNLLQEAK